MTTTYKLVDGNIIACTEEIIDPGTVDRDRAVELVASQQWEAKMFDIWLVSHIAACVEAKLPTPNDFHQGQIVAVRNSNGCDWQVGLFYEWVHKSWAMPTAAVTDSTGGTHEWMFCRDATESEITDFESK